MRQTWSTTLAMLGLAFTASEACTASSTHRDTESTRGEKAAVTDCNGLFGTTPAPDGEYDGTSFGCWVDANGNEHADSGDNCIPSCLSQAQQDLCAGLSGPDCEKQLNWYSADAARFGCMARIRVTNEANNKSVVLAALDNGPNCKLERAIDKPLLDMSGAATEYLFGGEVGYKDGASVHVDVVDPSTPLGPDDGSSTTGGTSGGSSGGQGGSDPSGSSSGGTGGSDPSGSSSSSGGMMGGAPPDAMARAQAAMGFSYWWGHGAWLDSGPGSEGGSCDGSCPSCSHDGSYGADCSGFVAKVWQVPADNNDITIDSHPYSTADFNQDSSEW